MKKPYIFLALSPPVFFSCKKYSVSTTAGYFVKYKLDEVLVSNSKLNYNWLNSNDNMASFQIYSNAEPHRQRLGIIVQRLGGVVTGAYNGKNNAYILVIQNSIPSMPFTTSS